MRIFGRESAESARPEGAKSPVSRALAFSSSRIGEIVRAANTAAADITLEADALRRAEGSAESRISRERLVAELADSLVARAEELKRDAKNLADVLDRASMRLDMTPAANCEPVANDRPATSEASPSAEAKVAAVSATSEGRSKRQRGTREKLQDKVADRFESPSDEAPATGRAIAFKRRSSASPRIAQPTTPSADGLRLLATQMAVAGSGREEIEDRLNKDFGIDDASTLLEPDRHGPRRGPGEEWWIALPPART